MNNPLHSFMTKQAIKLESLEQILLASDDRRWAEASLAALREVVPGDHFSAILFNTKDHTVEDYFLDQGWLASNHLFWQAAQQGLADHLLAQIFLSRHQSMALVRSLVVPDPAWKMTWVYNEVERPLGVEDIATVCQITAADQVVIITCGRNRHFADDDLAAIQSYQRVLNGLVASRVGDLGPHRTQRGRVSGAVAQSPLSTLTVREQEILHWVREGKRDPEISIILDISSRTVSNHLASIYRKLSVETRTAAAFIQ